MGGFTCGESCVGLAGGGRDQEAKLGLEFLLPGVVLEVDLACRGGWVDGWVG